MKGALRYQNEEEIDILDIGLPVSHFLAQERQNELLEKYEGKPNNLGDGNQTIIHRITILPQPLGGYLELANHLDKINAIIQSGSNFSLDPFPNAESLSKICMLVVDTGENTLDWLLVDQGRINTKASGTTSDSGRHRIVRAPKRFPPQSDPPLPPTICPASTNRCAMGRDSAIWALHTIWNFDPVMRVAVEDPINRLIEGPGRSHRPYRRGVRSPQHVRRRAAEALPKRVCLHLTDEPFRELARLPGHLTDRCAALGPASPSFGAKKRCEFNFTSIRRCTQGSFTRFKLRRNAKRRAALVKTFAERHLTGAQNALCSKGPFFDAGTYSLPPHKYQFAKPALTGLPLVSTGVDMPVLTATPTVSAEPGIQTPAKVDSNDTGATNAHKMEISRTISNPVLTGTPLVSTGVSGANALAAVLSDQMLGLVR